MRVGEKLVGIRLYMIAYSHASKIITTQRHTNVKRRISHVLLNVIYLRTDAFPIEHIFHTYKMRNLREGETAMRTVSADIL